jgi:hypothetical protein
MGIAPETRGLYAVGLPVLILLLGGIEYAEDKK